MLVGISGATLAGLTGYLNGLGGGGGGGWGQQGVMGLLDDDPLDSPKSALTPFADSDGPFHYYPHPHHQYQQAVNHYLPIPSRK